MLSPALRTTTSYEDPLPWPCIAIKASRFLDWPVPAERESGWEGTEANILTLVFSDVSDAPIGSWGEPFQRGVHAGWRSAASDPTLGVLCANVGE